MLEIGTIRNSIAHFRPIKKEDIGLIKQNSRHTLIEAEKCLQHIFSLNLRVPTNTSDEWYKSISTLGTEQVLIIPFYSADENWVKIQLKFSAPVFEKRESSNYWYDYLMAKVNTPNILTSHKDLKKYVTYVNEFCNYPVLTSDDYDIEISKHINFVFRKDVLEANFESISVELKAALHKISEEYSLLAKDNLARGELIEAASVSAWWSQPDEDKKGKWNFYYSNLQQEYETGHPDEYWGQHQPNSDFVAGCQRYPWMAADISQKESHFL